ncbi:PorP/SprF family type IX secretion system membrane protein [Aestuariivivens insulae]|uniref:PorP/SprF family type IX secretion system membrane protein n=1 Tax=Aestuariivivens insulae TaxID=1621988 RepID=UPI001F55F933|nr:type IX secretion system membrane protein PorP/SprF [Aestuariivivens insulae]
MVKQLLLYIVLFACIQQFNAQEDGVVALDLPIRNGLRFNRYAINPTFSFVREQNKYISFTNKRQWVQFDNAPQTNLFSYSGRFRENIGAGIGLFQQDYGVLTTFGGILNFAYNAVLNRDNNLTFGINLGFYQSGINDGKVVTNFPDSSLDNIPTNSVMTINPGINYGTAFFDFGLSVNNLVAYNFKTSKMLEENPEQSVQAHAMYTGYMNSRGFFDQSKFSTLIRSEFKKNNTIFSGIVMLAVPKGIWAQAAYNTLYGVSAGIGLNLTKEIALEYNYEQAIGDLSGFGNSHEITIAYKFKKSYRYNYADDDDEEALIMPSNRSKGIAARRKAASNSNRPRVVRKPRTVKENNKIAEATNNEQKAQTQKEEQERLEAEKATKLQAEQEAAKLAEEARKKVEAEAKLKAEAAAKLKAEQQAQAKLAEETRLKDERERQAKIAEEQRLKAEAAAKLKAEQVAQAKLAEENRLKVERERQAKLAEEQRLKAEAAAKLKAEQEAQARLAEETRLKAERERQAKIVEEQRLKAEAAAKLKAEQEAQARLAEETRLKAERERQAKIVEEQRLQAEAAAKLKAEQEAQAKLAEETRLKAERERQAKLAEEARLKEEAEAKTKAEKDLEIGMQELDGVLVPVAKDRPALEMGNLTALSEKSKIEQQGLLDQLKTKVASKQKDLDDLKKENDLSEQGIYTAPKAFKSISAENREIEALKVNINNLIESQEVQITELERLYKERLKTVRDRTDKVNVFYLQKINELKSQQEQAVSVKANLLSELEVIKEATEVERKRRIKRAAYDNEQVRYQKDRATLEQIRQITPISNEPLKPEDFDSGEVLSNIQILKGVNNIENGYYLVVAVHTDTKKRDEFLRKAIAAGQTNIDFFFDVNSSKYYIYYQKFDYIEGANRAMESKGKQPYNTNMSVVKIED